MIRKESAGYAAVIVAMLSIGAWAQMQTMVTNESRRAVAGPATNAVAMFGAGCFWCTEAVFQRIPGVLSVQSGYAGGGAKRPSYEQVSTGETGHAEVIRLVYDPTRVPYERLLDTFWAMHDPTTLNRQGADVGSQYRSVIYTFTPEQQRAAVAAKDALNASGRFERPIVTEILPAPEFYPAEPYHNNYFNLNRQAPYCRFVIAPKLEKLKLGE